MRRRTEGAGSQAMRLATRADTQTYPTEETRKQRAARRRPNSGGFPGRDTKMAMSGPRGSHHQDDEEYAPSVFSDINITPLTDIFLVLLIIFMVGSSIVVEQAQGGGTGVRVDLPKGAAKELQAAPRDFPVAVLKDGTVVTEGKEIDMGALKERFAKLAKDAPDAQVIIQ